MTERAQDLFEMLGLPGAKDRYPSQLSGGVRQRVSIARVLVHEPSIVMMDEAFGTLNAIGHTQIRHDIELLRLETRKTMMFITRSIEEVICLSDRMPVMSRGPACRDDFP